MVIVCVHRSCNVLERESCELLVSFLLLVLCWGALNEVQAIESYSCWIQSLKIVQQALKADIFNRVRVLCVGGMYVDPRVYDINDQ